MPPVGATGHQLRQLLLTGAATILAAPATACLAGESPLVQKSHLPEPASLLTAMTIGKVFASLLVVVGLMLVLLYLIKRSGLGSGRARAGSAIAVLETRMVAPKKYIAIVEIAGHCLALGITDHTISLLRDLGPEAKELLTNPPSSGRPESAFAGLLHKSIQSWQEATTRRRDNRTDRATNDTPKDTVDAP